jgi:Ca2+-binding RTX toxin-like protein
MKNRMFIRRAAVERLEERRLMASDISAALSNGVLTVDGSDANDVILVRQVNDTLTVDGVDGVFRVQDVRQLVVDAKGGNDVVDLSRVGPAAGKIATEIRGGAGHDLLLGREGPDVIAGGAGDDVLTGFDGNDQLDAGDGNNFVYGGAGNDVLAASAGKDYLHGGSGDDTLRGGGGDDHLQGGDGADQLHGGDGRDALYGALGNDSLYGDAGDDLLDAAAGDDHVSGAEGADEIYGGEGHDRLFGGNDADKIYGGNGDDRLYGENGDDRLSAGDGADVVWGGAGNDQLGGGLGSDALYGESGIDKFYDDFWGTADDTNAAPLLNWLRNEKWYIQHLDGGLTREGAILFLFAGLGSSGAPSSNDNPGNYYAPPTQVFASSVNATETVPGMSEILDEINRIYASNERWGEGIVPWGLHGAPNMWR